MGRKRFLGACGAALMAATAMVVVTGAPDAGAAPGATASGQTVLPRSSATITALTGDRVLLSGGYVSSNLSATAEIFDLTTRTSTLVAPMHVARAIHADIAMDDGRVLLVGGRDSAGEQLAAAEIYDPTTDTWTVTATPANRYEGGRLVHLPDGRVLALGRSSGGEIYDPETDTWTLAPLPWSGGVTDAVGLADGRVLAVTGHASFGRAATFEVATSEWTTVPASGVAGPRLARLGDGRVMAHSASVEEWPDTEIFDPAAGSWTPAVDPTFGRYATDLASLPDGRVALVGGTGSSVPTTTVEIYDPVAGSWSFAARLQHPHFFTDRATMTDGRVVLAPGGSCSPGEFCEAQVVEIFDPAAVTPESPYFFWWGGGPNKRALQTGGVGLSPILKDDATGWGIAGRHIRFTVSGKNAGAGVCDQETSGCVTNSDGLVFWGYVNGDDEPGTDTVFVHADTDDDGVVDPGEATATSTITWRKYATRVVANPALVHRGKTVSTLAARVVVVPLDGGGQWGASGKTVRFTNGVSELCRAVTDYDGWARCGTSTTQLQGATYEAFFDGDEEHNPSSGRGLPIG